MKNTKNIIRICAAFLFAFVFMQMGYGQMRENLNSEEYQDKIKAQKVAFITDKLDLSTKEAKKFWPVYEEYVNLVKEEKAAFKKSQDQKPKDLESLSKEDAAKMLDDLMVHEQSLLDLRKQFKENLSLLFSPNRILMLFEAEKEFRRSLMKRLSQGRGQQSGTRRQGRSPNQ